MIFTFHRYEERDQHQEQLVAMDAKKLDKQEQEREQWKQKIASQVAKEEKKKNKNKR
jgi:hypothetical protein